MSQSGARRQLMHSDLTSDCMSPASHLAHTRAQSDTPTPSIKQQLARRGRVLVATPPQQSRMHDLNVKGVIHHSPSSTFSYLPLGHLPFGTSHNAHATHYKSDIKHNNREDSTFEDNGLDDVHTQSSTPSDALYYTAVPKRPVFNFEQHRTGRLYYPEHGPGTHGDAYRSYTRKMKLRPGTAPEMQQRRGNIFAHSSSHEPPANDVRIQREHKDDRVWPDDAASVAVQVFMSRRHPYAATTAQEMADERSLRSLIVQFLVSRLDAKNALAIWDLADRTQSKELAEAAFEYTQRNLQVIVSASEGFWDLPFSHVLKLVTSDNLMLFNEAQACELLCQWAHVDDLRRAQLEVMRFKERVAELESLRGDVYPLLQLRLETERLCEDDKEQHLRRRRDAYIALTAELEAARARRTHALDKCVAAQQRLGRVSKGLPKAREMKLRFFNMQPPECVRRVMCAVGVLLRIPGELVGPVSTHHGASGPPSARSSPLKYAGAYFRGNGVGDGADGKSIGSRGDARDASLDSSTGDAQQVSVDGFVEGDSVGHDHGVSILSPRSSGADPDEGDLLPLTPRGEGSASVVTQQLSMTQALQLYNDPSLPVWLRQVDPFKLTIKDCQELHRFTGAKDFDSEALKRRLGKSKQQLVLAFANFCLMVQDTAIWNLRSRRHQEQVDELAHLLVEAEQRLCDAESAFERQQTQVSQLREELLALTGRDAQVDLDLELSFQRLVLGNDITRTRLVRLLNKVRWAMVPHAFIESHLQEHPLVRRFQTRPDLQRALENALAMPRVTLCEASNDLKAAFGSQRLVRASIASSLDADIASVLKLQSAGMASKYSTEKHRGSVDRNSGWQGPRSQMKGLSWSRFVIAHELRSEGDYGGFLGTTEQGAAVVLGPRPGSAEARAGGKGGVGLGSMGDTVLFLIGGLGVDGESTRYVRIFVPDVGGGSWQECAPLVQARAFASAAFLPAPVSENHGERRHLAQQSAASNHRSHRPASTSSMLSRGMPRPGHASAVLKLAVEDSDASGGRPRVGRFDHSRQPPARIMVVGGVSDTQRFLKSAEVLDLTSGGLRVGMGHIGDTRKEAENWRMRQIMGGMGTARACSGQWEMIGGLNTARSQAQVLMINGSLYLAGGLAEDRTPVRTVERLRPSFASSWLRLNTDFAQSDESVQISDESVRNIRLNSTKNLLSVHGGQERGRGTSSKGSERGRSADSDSNALPRMDQLQQSFVGLCSKSRVVFGQNGKVKQAETSTQETEMRDSRAHQRLLDNADRIDSTGQPRPLPLSAGLHRPGGTSIEAIGAPNMNKETSMAIRPWSRDGVVGNPRQGATKKTYAMMLQERKEQKEKKNIREHELDLAASYLPAHAPTSIDLSTEYLAQEFGGNKARSKATSGNFGQVNEMQGVEEGDPWVGGVSKRGPRKARDEVRHWDNPYWPYADPHNTCNVHRSPIGTHANDEKSASASSRLVLRAPSHVGTPFAPESDENGAAERGGGISRSQWWRNRTRFWSGRLRAAPAGNIVPFVTESELRIQKTKLKPVSRPIFDQYVSVRGPGGALGGFGGSALSTKGQRWGALGPEKGSHVQEKKDSANGDTLSSQHKMDKNGARLGTPLLDRITAVAGNGQSQGVRVLEADEKERQRLALRPDRICEHYKQQMQCKECAMRDGLGARQPNLLQRLPSPSPEQPGVVRDWVRNRREVALRDEARASLGSSLRRPPTAQQGQTSSYSPSHVVAGESAWQEVMDPESGNTFFWNPTTGESSWLRPDNDQGPTADPKASTVTGKLQDQHAKNGEVLLQESRNSADDRNDARKYSTRAGPSPRLPRAGRSQVVGGQSPWHPGSSKVHGSGALTQGARVMAPWRAEALAREDYFAHVSGSATTFGKHRAGGEHGAGHEGASMSGQVARSLLFNDDTWETIQPVWQRGGGVGGSGQRDLRVVEYVLGRPWQTDYSSLDPSTSFLISQGCRGLPGGSRAGTGVHGNITQNWSEGARARDVQFTFRPLNNSMRRGAYVDPTVGSELPDQPTYIPTPPPSKRTADQLREIAWGRGWGPVTSWRKMNEIRNKLGEDKEERDRRCGHEHAVRQNFEDEENKPRETEEAQVDPGVDSNPIEDGERHASKFRRHYYSFHVLAAIKIQGLARGRALRLQMAQFRQLAAVHFAKVREMHLEELCVGDPNGASVGAVEQQSEEKHCNDIPLSSVMQHLRKMGWGESRLQHVRLAIAAMGQKGRVAREGGGRVGAKGFFRMALHVYIHEAHARKARGGFYLPDEERLEECKDGTLLTGTGVVGMSIHMSKDHFQQLQDLKRRYAGLPSFHAPKGEQKQAQQQKQANREQERMQERLEGQIANWEEEVKELKEEHSRLRERQHLLLEMKDATSGMSPVSAISPRSRQSRMERDVRSSRIESEVETLKQRIFVAREMICAALEEDEEGEKDRNLRSLDDDGRRSSISSSVAIPSELYRSAPPQGTTGGQDASRTGSSQEVNSVALSSFEEWNKWSLLNQSLNTIYSDAANDPNDRSVT